MPFDLLMFADGFSIHTARWVEGLAGDERFRLHLLSMNPAGWHQDIERCAHLIATRQIIAPSAIRQSGGNIAYFWLVPAIRRAIQHLRPTLINAHYLSSYGCIAAVLKPRACRLVQTIHGTDGMVFPWRSRVHAALSAFSLSRADLVVSVSEPLTQKISELAGRQGQLPIVTLQYGLKDDVFSTFSGGTVYDVISNRAWVKNSNIPLIVDALKRLVGERRFLVCGNQAGMSEADRTRLFDDDRIEVRGELSHTELMSVVATSRVYVSMTQSDGTSLSLLEAMALGAIPVVSDLPANRAWVVNGVNGFVVSAFEPTSLFHRLEQALSLSEADRRRMQSANRLAMQAKASFRNNMAMIRSRFAELCVNG